jgi:hypothetical protein
MILTETQTRIPALDAPARAAAEEVRAFGSTVLRQAWPKAPLARLQAAITEFSARRAARVAAGESAVPSEKMYSTHGVGTFAGLVMEGVIGPEIIPELFVGSAYHALCAAYFEDDAFYCAFSRVGFRNHDPKVSDKSFIPYHQDSYTQDKRVPRVLNCWIPLDPGAGRISPGLEVVRNPCMPDFPRKDFGLKSENAAYDFITIDRAKIVEVYGECFLAPEFEVGDGLVFSENVIHRTYVTPQMTQPRINFELRVFTPKCLAPGVSVADLGALAHRIA